MQLPSPGTYCARYRNGGFLRPGDMDLSKFNSGIEGVIDARTKTVWRAAAVTEEADEAAVVP